MKRLIVQPRSFGSCSGYEWEPTSISAQAHHDYCALYQTEYSCRVWDPGRNSLSNPGVPPIAGIGNYEAVPLPVAAHIRGIKGEARFRFDGTREGVGVWLDDNTGVPFVNQPTWEETYYALAGMPTREPTIYLDQAAVDNSLACHIPLFCAMYRGTYKQIDSAAGWEIDSGPGDDPDVLLGLDITSPSVLESSRLDWWDIDWVPAPRYANVAPTPDDDVFYNLPERPDKGAFHKYALNLDSNKRVASDQVLWLHWKTGIIRLPVFITPDAGGPQELVCALYANHRFSMSVHASMLVDTRVTP